MFEQDIYKKMYKKISEYIFVTFEWHTFQPWSNSLDPDVENMQVIWFWKGFSRDEAYENLIKNNNYLLETSFNEIWCMKIANNKYDCMFSLDEAKENCKENNYL